MREKVLHLKNEWATFVADDELSEGEVAERVLNEEGPLFEI